MSEDTGPWCTMCGRGIAGPDHPSAKLDPNCAYCRQRAATGTVSRYRTEEPK